MAINTIKITPCTQKVKRSFIDTIRYICVTSILFLRVGLCNHKSIETEHTIFIPYFMFQKIKDLIETKKEFFSSEEYSQLKSIIEKAEEREKEKKGENKCSTSDELKAKGNEQFRNGDYDEAILTYTEAIEVDPMNHVLYSNRAAAYAKSGLTENGIEDCLKAIEIDNSYVKAYIRLGDFYSEDDKEKAEETYLKGLEIDPANMSLKEKLERLKQKESIPKGNGKFDINEMMKNPEIMKMAQEMMGNKSKEELDEMLKNLMNNK